MVQIHVVSCGSCIIICFSKKLWVFCWTMVLGTRIRAWMYLLLPAVVVSGSLNCTEKAKVCVHLMWMCSYPLSMYLLVYMSRKHKFTLNMIPNVLC